ncbi:MAG: Serine/threonine protein kinase [Chthoniobacteraceae bacterium]|nr:Serine/threonine protein kinase [Chthoniobacteraceae bacterium]
MDLAPEITPDSQIQPCPHCSALIDVGDEEPLTEIVCPGCNMAMTVRGRVSHFELVDVAGRGGMGVVYKAHDSGLDRDVALKLLRKDHSDNVTLIAQLETEAAITASINHPHVVKVFSTGSDRGRFFIVMELVDKGSLDDLMRIQGRVTEAQTLEVAIDIANGLKAAREHGLIHRDVKPGNILFADAHTAKIVDFGLAIFMEQEESARGEIWGTPYYVAPEKLDGKAEDFRSDIYSLGATLFHAMAGRPPFEAESASLVALKHLKSQPVSLQAFAPHVSGRTAFIINRTLLKDPDARYQSYEELIEHLQYAREELLDGAGKVPQSKRVVLESEQDQQAWGWVTLGMIVLILAGAGVLFFFRSQIFGDAMPAATAASVEKAAAAPQGESGVAMQKARAKLLDGHALEAADAFRAIKANAKLPKVEAAWASLQEGIAELQAAHVPAAQNAFKALGQEGVELSNEPANARLGALFVELSRHLEGTTAAGSLKDIDKNEPEIITLLAVGLKDWQLGNVEESVTLLRQFRSATPTGPYAWIADLKPLASQCIEDFTRFQMLAERMKSAESKEQAAAVSDEFKKFSGPLITRAQSLESATSEKIAAIEKSLDGWMSADFGETNTPGSTIRDPASGVISIKSSGTDLYGTSDSARFVYKAISGDFEFSAKVARIDKTDEFSKAGICIRKWTRADSRNVAMALTTTRIGFQVRPESGKDCTEVLDTKIGAPQWVKIVRQGSTMTGFHSADGKTWIRLGEHTFDAMPPELFAGFVVSSHGNGALATGVFESVQLKTKSSK